ncbi:MAG: endonuclease III [Deferribacterota bacterium]|nr:endonuclease III [Deferribacterota bacterium]
MEDKVSIANKLIDFLNSKFPNAKCSLNYNNPFQLLVATILSARCTDERVNKVTEKIFKKYNSPQAFANAPLSELSEDIKPTGFYKNKSKNIKELSSIIVKKFSGQVPSAMDELLTLPGVGRKTANVVLGNCFSKPALVVDTHVKRVVKRLGIVNSDDPDKIEKELMNILGEKTVWTKWSHQVIAFGREICKARKPLCHKCPLQDYCKYYKGSISS